MNALGLLFDLVVEIVVSVIFNFIFINKILFTSISSWPCTLIFIFPLDQIEVLKKNSLL